MVTMCSIVNDYTDIYKLYLLEEQKKKPNFMDFFFVPLYSVYFSKP